MYINTSGNLQQHTTEIIVKLWYRVNWTHNFHYISITKNISIIRINITTVQHTEGSCSFFQHYTLSFVARLLLYNSHYQSMPCCWRCGVAVYTFCCGGVRAAAWAGSTVIRLVLSPIDPDWTGALHIGHMFRCLSHSKRHLKVSVKSVWYSQPLLTDNSNARKLLKLKYQSKLELLI